MTSACAGAGTVLRYVGNYACEGLQSGLLLGPYTMKSYILDNYKRKQIMYENDILIKPIRMSLD